MSINPTTLKAQIDSEITNEIVDFAITPAEVGGRMKDIVDYTTENVVVKKIKVSLSSSQILNLYTTPIELVPAVPGKLLVPQFLFQKYTHVSSAYTTSGLFRIGLGTITFGFSSFGAVITSADNAEGLNNFSYNQSTSGSTYESLPIVLGATSANPSGGNGTLDLYLTYLEITL
jgi:hypothetical protein